MDLSVKSKWFWGSVSFRRAPNWNEWRLLHRSHVFPRKRLSVMPYTLYIQLGSTCMSREAAGGGGAIKSTCVVVWMDVWFSSKQSQRFWVPLESLVRFLMLLSVTVKPGYSTFMHLKWMDALRWRAEALQKLFSNTSTALTCIVAGGIKVQFLLIPAVGAVNPDLAQYINLFWGGFL